MTYIRYLLRAALLVLFVVFGASMAFAVPMATSNITYFDAEPTHIVQADDVGFAARAPPLAATNVAVTGGVTVMRRGAFALHGQETVAPPFGFGADHIAPNRVATQFPDGTFSVSDWRGYPSGVTRPPEGTTYRLITGSDYAEARRLANNANAQIRRSGVVPDGHEIHEIVPVKYGGSPTDPTNKVYLPRGTHRSEVTPWWNRLQRDLER